MAVLAGAALVFFAFPKDDEEKRLLAHYRTEDAPAAPSHKQEHSTARTGPAP